MLSFKPTVQHFANFNLWVQTGIRSFKKYLGRVLLNFAYLRKRYKKKTNTWIEKSICYHTPEFAFGDSIKELENKYSKASFYAIIVSRKTLLGSK